MVQEEIRILLIEDNDAHVYVLDRIFRAHPKPFLLKTVYTLNEARRILNSFSPNLILANLLLPDGSGTELLTRQEKNLFPLVVMTSHGDEEMAVEAMKAGALDYVVKTEANLTDMPHIVLRTLREWDHITKRRKAEDALREERDRAQKYLDIAGVIFIVINENEEVTLINEKGCEILGYRQSEVLGKNWFFNFLPKDIQNQVRSVFVKLMRGEVENMGYFENVVLTKSGEERIIAWHNTILKDDEGKISGTLSSGEDITERKRAEDALRASEEKFRQFFEHEPEYCFIIAPDYTVMDVNHAIVENLGYKEEEIIGRFIQEFYTGESQTIWEKIFTQQDSLGNITDEELVILTKDGQKRSVLLSVGVVRDQNENILHYISVQRDVTERIEAEQAIRNSLSEKEVLIKEIHHRVKNNLQIICSLLNLQARKIKDPHALESYQECRDRIRSMAIIHEKLYASDTLTEIDFQSYISTLTQNLFHSYRIDPNQVDLDIHIDDVQLGIDMAVPCGLIINELVSNALKYAFLDNRSEKGIITIELKLDGPHILLSVKDNGIGLPKEIDVHNTESLGLHLVILLAEDQLNGTVQVEREQGTSFQIQIPRDNES